MDYIGYLEDLICDLGIDRADIELGYSKESGMGDFAMPCFKLAKNMRKPPRLIAEELKAKINLPEFIEKAEAVNGYLNFYLKNSYKLPTTVEEVIAKGIKNGSSQIGAGKTVCIDYSSINIAKPFHIGHLSTTVIGAALYRLFGALGYNVVGINHLGDWGTQFGKLIVAYKLWGDRGRIDKYGVKELLNLYVKFHEEAEKDPGLEDEGRKWFRKIEEGDKTAYEIFNYFKEITLKEVQRVYKRLNITFDSYNGESFYNDKMEPVLKELEEKGLIETSEGAKVVKLEGMPPCLLVKADGATLYATRDLAAAFTGNRITTFTNASRCAYQQNLHFKQVFEVIRLMGYDWADDPSISRSAWCRLKTARFRREREKSSSSKKCLTRRLKSV